MESIFIFVVCEKMRDLRKCTAKAYYRLLWLLDCAVFHCLLLDPSRKGIFGLPLQCQDEARILLHIAKALDMIEWHK